MSLEADLLHIEAALRLAGRILVHWADNHTVERKADGQPVTEADLEADRALREFLPRTGEGWLSEETHDDRQRLKCSRVWVVDPLDGTKEFVHGVPEWAVSIGLVEAGEAIAGGIYNPLQNHLILGGIGAALTLNGEPVQMSEAPRLRGARVVASRSEIRRGEWDRYRGAGLQLVPMGSVAYKLGLVAAGQADLMWTHKPKNEWDVAAGVALVRAGGGEAWLPDGTQPHFNRVDPRLPGLAVAPRQLAPALRELLGWQR